jgi:hypothetical protein
MAEMARSARVTTLVTEFDDFLFAPIGEDRNGMLLSVVSALARLDVDPWQEAANLAQLPGITATRRLVSLIGALPDRPLAHMDTAAVAARLIARLPHRAASDAPPAEVGFGFQVPAVMQSQPFRYGAFIVLVVVLGGLTIAASQRSAPQIHNAVAPASSPDIPTPRSPISGQ